MEGFAASPSDRAQAPTPKERGSFVLSCWGMVPVSIPDPGSRLITGQWCHIDGTGHPSGKRLWMVVTGVSG